VLGSLIAVGLNLLHDDLAGESAIRTTVRDRPPV
jgi:hypothetical protein